MSASFSLSDIKNAESQGKIAGFDDNTGVPEVKVMGGKWAGAYFNALRPEDQIFRKFVSDAPKWRYVIAGLNYEAICKNPHCEAYKRKTWVQKGYGEFDVINDIFEGVICPMCKKPAEDPINAGLLSCTAEIKGKLLRPEKKVVSNTIVAGDGGVTTFKEDEELANWATLTISVNRN